MKATLVGNLIQIDLDDKPTTICAVREVGNKGWVWCSSMWMRSSKKYHSSHASAVKAACKSLNLSVE